MKWAYNRLPANLRFVVLWPAFVQMWWKRLLKDAPSSGQHVAIAFALTHAHSGACRSGMMWSIGSGVIRLRSPGPRRDSSISAATADSGWCV